MEPNGINRFETTLEYDFYDDFDDSCFETYEYKYTITWQDVDQYLDEEVKSGMKADREDKTILDYVDDMLEWLQDREEKKAYEEYLQKRS